MTTDLFSLHDKLALVTGGCSGIGLAVVQRFIAAGARVVAADLSDSAGRFGSNAEFISLDVTSERAVAEGFAELESRWGKLDVLVNNAGVALPEGLLEQADVTVWQRTLSVNLGGVLHGLKYGPRHMNDGGSIINTASLAAFATFPAYSGYAVSKAGVIRLTEQAAVELGQRGIRVNAVCPGTTLTPMEPGDSDEVRACPYLNALGRPATPGEQAAVFHFLAADDSRFVNGTTIRVDGGWVHGVTPAGLAKLLA